MSITLNTGATDLSTAYSSDYYKPGTKYIDDDGGVYTWGVYSDSSVTTSGDVVCVPIVSSTNPALFTRDVTDTDADIQMQVGYAPAQMTSGKRGWFKTGGYHKVKECSTTAAGLTKGTMFRVVATDGTIAPCTTFAQAAGITLENFSSSATSYKYVRLFAHGRAL